MSMCSSLLYLMRILGNHGIPETSLKGAFRAIVLSRLLHALLHDLVSVLRQIDCDSRPSSEDTDIVTRIHQEPSNCLMTLTMHSFNACCTGQINHVVQYLLQDREPVKYSLRSRSHAKELIQKTPNLNNF